MPLSDACRVTIVVSAKSVGCTEMSLRRGQAGVTSLEGAVKSSQHPRFLQSWSCFYEIFAVFIIKVRNRYLILWIGDRFEDRH